MSVKCVVVAALKSYSLSGPRVHYIQRTVGYPVSRQVQTRFHESCGKH